MMYTKLL